MARKILNQNEYAFNAVAKTITFTQAYELAHIEVITNITRGVMIYRFDRVNMSGTVAGNVLTLAFDTSGQSNNDKLQIYVNSDLVPNTVAGFPSTFEVSNFPASFNVDNFPAFPIGQATEAKQDVQTTELTAIKNKDFSTAAKQDTQTAELTAIKNKDFATAAKQDTQTTELTAIKNKDFATQTTLAAILAKIIGSPATEAKQDTGNTHLSNINTNVAKDGTDGSGITPPTGGTGIRGWLSGIYQRLGNTLSVTFTNTSIQVSNFPTSTEVSNFPASTQVSNFPATQAVSGAVSITSPRNRVGQYALSSFRTLGTAATPQNIFSIANPAASGKKLAVKKIEIIFDTTAALATVAPSIKLSRATALPTGGTTLTAVKWNTADANAVAICRGGTASDGGVATAITATAGSTITTQFVDRLHTAVGFVQHKEYTLLFELAKDDPFILLENESLLVQAVLANAATTHFVVNIVWEEYA